MMPGLTDTAIHLYRKYLRSAVPGSEEQGHSMVMVGDQAVAIAEAAITQTQMAPSTLDRWLETASAGNTANIETIESPRGSLASAIGLALAGRRATSFLNGPDIAAAQDLLVSAAGRHLPLVIHLNNQALAGHGGSLGSGHEAFHLSSESGFFTLFASSVQQAVDFTFIARRVAEQTLVPGLVVMDREQTAMAIQEVDFLSLEQIRAFLGSADEEIPVPTPAQQLLFGDSRRRVPAWHNLDKPVLQGALYDPESYALGALANQPFFDAYLDACLEASFDQFEKLTGRLHRAISTHGCEKAEVVLLAQGAAVEPLTLVAGYLRNKEKERIGVIGVHCLRPFPERELLACLKGKKTVAVMERLAKPLAGDPPLLREIRACLGRAIENTKFSKGGSAAITHGDTPHCCSVSYGLGGSPLRVSDMIALSSRLSTLAHSENSSWLALGIDFQNDVGNHPKRQVLLDALARAYPGIEKLGLRSNNPAPDIRGDQSLSIALKRISGLGYESLHFDISTLLHRLEGGMMRGRSSLSWESWGEVSVDRLIHSQENLLDSGDDALVDVSMAVLDEPSLNQLKMLKIDTGVREGGAIIIPCDLTDTEVSQILSLRLREAVQTRKISIYKLPSPQQMLNSISEIHSRSHQYKDRIGREYLLGSLFGVLLDIGLLDQKERKILASKENLLKELPEEIQSIGLDAFQQGFNDICQVDISKLIPLDTDAHSASLDKTMLGREAPVAVRHLGRDDDHYDSLPRLWDQVGVLYRDDERDLLTADPYFATGTIAPLSSTFRDFSHTHSLLPWFDSSLCTGCGKCWTTCPDSAIGVVAISPGTLLDTGIRLAGADSLRQVASQISARIISRGKKNELPQTAGEVFKEALTWLKDKMKLTPERQEAIEEGFEGINKKIGGLPVAVTDIFFHKAENLKKDSAELFSLAINPDACKGCGLCMSVCEPLALHKNTDRLNTARELWNIYSQIPDTPADTIDRVAKDPEPGPLAALNLSRYCLLAMAGGDGAEPGSGEKITMRMVLAVTEYLQQPLTNRFAFDIKTVVDEIGQLLKENLSTALPTEDLDALTRSLNQIREPLVDLSTLANKLEGVAEDRSIDTTLLRRLVRLLEDLAEHHWRLTQGEQGLGRSRFGLALTQGSVASWAGAFPYNSFQAPVLVDLTSDTPQIAAGLVEGHLRDTCESLVIMRKARLEIDKPTGSEFKRAALDNLIWQDLNEEEKALCPPLFLVGNDDLLAGPGLSQVLWLLKSGLPIKILVLADLDLGISSTFRWPLFSGKTDLHRRNNPRGNIAYLAMAERRAYVAQTSISKPEHLYQSVSEALKFSGPALLHIHAPSPQRHGFDSRSTLAQARLAVDTRAFPLFQYHPQAEGVYGTRISLNGNSEPSETWVTDDNDQLLNPAHWAMTENRFDAEFRLLNQDDVSPVDIQTWLEMDVASRKKHTPCLSVYDNESFAGIDVNDDEVNDDEVNNDEAKKEVRYRIAPDLAYGIDQLGQDWRVLQELSGLVTPFTARVEQQAQEKIKEAHLSEISSQKSEYEQRISDLETEMRMEMAGKIRNQLLKLVQSRTSSNGASEAANKVRDALSESAKEEARQNQ